MKKTPQNIFADSSIMLSIFLVSFFLLFPFIWMVSTSLKPQNEIFSKGLEIIPRDPTIENYKKFFFRTDFSLFFFNSFFIVSIAVIFTVALSSFAAYGFSRYIFPWKNSLLVMILFSQFFPWIILVTPLYIIFQKFNLINTYTGLIFTYIAITVPFCIFMLISYFETVPRDLDDAARIDGCSDLGVIFRVILPVSWPGLVAITIYAFIQGWNEFVFAVTFMTKTRMKTVPVGLYALFGEFGIEWDQLMCASTMAAVPAMVIFLFLQKYLVQGLTAGATKG